VQYIGLDTVDAKSHFGYDAPDTLYLSGDSWPVETGSIDVLLCTETLEHVPDSARFLAEASRCICDGGRLILTVPFAARWHFIPYDYWRFTPSGLEWLLENAGFAAIRVFARGNALTVACYKSMALILPMLFPREASIALSWMLRLFGLILSPLLLLLALVANLSLRGAGGDDCLGYTVLATRSSQPPSAAAREAVHES
jgi:SAM-dependent methyltransferase